MKEKSSFPETVEFKSCTATIYFQNNRNSTRYEIRYYDVDGSRQRLTFLSYADARKFGDAVVRALADNRENFVTLRGPEAYNYRSAIELLPPTGFSLLQAVTLVADSTRLLDGRASILEAVKYYLENRPQKSPDITVREVAERLLALKAKEGDVGQLYLRDLRLRFEKFASAFQCAISKVTPEGDPRLFAEHGREQSDSSQPTNDYRHTIQLR